MINEDRDAMLHEGLEQLNTEAVNRVLAHLEAGGPVLLDGEYSQQQQDGSQHY